MTDRLTPAMDQNVIYKIADLNITLDLNGLRYQITSFQGY